MASADVYTFTKILGGNKMAIEEDCTVKKMADFHVEMKFSAFSCQIKTSLRISPAFYLYPRRAKRGS